MNPFRTLGREFRFNFGSLKRLIPIIAIMFIPILYAGTFLWAFWDPYGHLNRLPVAMVNQDQGATYQGNKIEAGQQLEDNLKKNHDFDWHFVSERAAKEGLVNNKYFMVITIPSGFSEEAAKAANTPGSPQPKLQSVTNDRHNYIAGIIGKNAMDKMKEQTAQQLTKTYTSNLVTGISQLETGFDKASSGASQLASGANQLTQGSGPLVKGAGGIVSGSQTLSSSLQQAAAGAQAVAGGSKSVYQGNQQLSQGLQGLTGGASKLASASGQVDAGAQQLKSGLTSESGGAQQVATGTAKVAQGLAAYEQAHPELALDPNFQALLKGSQQTAGGAKQVSSASDALLQGATKLAAGSTQMKQGMAQFTPQLQKASQGASALVQQEPSLVQGSQLVVSGLAQLQSGATQLQSGAGSLASGVSQYTNGATKVASGATNLANQLASAKGNLPAVNKGQVVSATSNPVGVTLHQTGGINNYGNGFAPYFLSLGLFVGALLMSIVIAFREPAEKPASGFAWFLSKTVLVSAVGVIQSLLADAILLYGLGVHVQNVTDFILFSLLTSLMFVSLIQLLVATMANPGRFIAVIILILQLTTSSGTYPVILSPQFFQNIAPYLPMTYTVDGFRYLVGGGNPSFMHSDIWHILIYWGAFLVLTLAFFLVTYRLTYRKDKPDGTSAQTALEM